MLKGKAVGNFATQEKSCEDLGSPFTAHLCRCLPELIDPQSRLGRLIADWPGDADSDALALRLCGALHFLVRAGMAPELSAVYPPDADMGRPLDAALGATLTRHDVTIAEALASPPQTNEVSRSGPLLGLLLHIADATGAALELNEIGASAGLNLWPDRWRYELGDGNSWGVRGAPATLECRWEGSLPPLEAQMRIAARAGCDLAPIDPSDPAARMRMLSFIWPDQVARLERAEAALALAAASSLRIECASAEEWLEARLARPQPEGTARVVMHSIMWQYLPVGMQDRISWLMAEAGTRTTLDRPLAWARLERSGKRGGPGERLGAALTLTLWPGGEERLMGRADFHGRWAEWNDTTAT